MVGTPPSGGHNAFSTPARVLDPLAGQGAALAVIAVGGALGALARYGVGLTLPHVPGSFPLATFLVNVVGCLLIGVLIVVITEWTRAHPLVRPFLGTGFLGGFTTFSTYAVEAQELLRAGRVAIAGAYLAGTLATAVAATWVGVRSARALQSARAR